MRKIKFRAIDIDSGDYVFAELGQVSAEIKPGYLTFVTAEGVYTVDSDTIQQFCGVDDNGEECYEGDYLTLINANGGVVSDIKLFAPLQLGSSLARIVGGERPAYLTDCKLVLDKERSHRND